MTRTWIVAALVALVALLGLFALLASLEEAAGRVDMPGPAGERRAAGSLAGDVTGAAGAHEASALPTAPAGGIEPLVLTLAPALVRGRVTASDGTPLRGAGVRVLGGAKSAPAVVSDAEGRYELALPGGTYHTIVAAQAEGRAEEQAWLQVVESRPRVEALDFVLVRQVRLAGRVTSADDGGPCAGASLVIKQVVSRFTGHDLNSGLPLATVVTDADGRFRCTLPGARVVSLEVTPALGAAPAQEAAGAAATSAVAVGAVKPLVTRVTVPLPEGGEHVVDVELPQPAAFTVTLRALGGDGAAVAPGGDARAAGREAGSAATTGASGAGAPLPAPLRLTLQPPEMVVNRHVPGAPESIVVPAGEGPVRFEPVRPGVDWDLTLTRGASFPLVLARSLRFGPGEDAQREFTYDPAALAPVPVMAPAGRSGQTMSFRFRFTDSEGRLLALDEFTQLADYDGSELLAEARSLVDDSVGIVRLDIQDSAAGVARVEGTTPPIEMTLRIAGRTLVRSPIGERDAVVLELLPPPQAATLLIRGVDGHGSQRTPGLVYLARCDTWATRIVVVHSLSEPLVSVEPGTCLVWAQVEHQETETVRVELRPGETRTVQLSGAPPGTVRGVLRPPPGPDERATVEAIQAGGSHPLLTPRAVMGADGRFELSALPAATWDLACLVSAAHGLERGPERVITQRGVRVAPGAVTDVVLENEASATGRVLLRASASVPCAVVSMRAEGGAPQPSCWLLAGEQRTLCLPAGRYTWEALDHEGRPLGALGAAAAFEVSADPSAPELVIDV